MSPLSSKGPSKPFGGVKGEEGGIQKANLEVGLNQSSFEGQGHFVGKVLINNNRR